MTRWYDQINIRLEPELLALVDGLIDGAVIRSRAQVVRVALIKWLETHRRNQTIKAMSTIRARCAEHRNHTNAKKRAAKARRK